MCVRVCARMGGTGRGQGGLKDEVAMETRFSLLFSPPSYSLLHTDSLARAHTKMHTLFLLG